MLPEQTDFMKVLHDVCIIEVFNHVLMSLSVEKMGCEAEIVCGVAPC